MYRYVFKNVAYIMAFDNGIKFSTRCKSETTSYSKTILKTDSITGDSEITRFFVSNSININFIKKRRLVIRIEIYV